MLKGKRGITALLFSGGITCLFLGGFLHYMGQSLDFAEVGALFFVGIGLIFLSQSAKKRTA